MLSNLTSRLILRRIIGLFSVTAIAALIACGGDEPEKESSKKAGGAKAEAAAESAEPAQPAAPADEFSPPTDEQIKKDVAGNATGIISIELDKAPGKKSWSDAHSQYFWEKWVTVKREAQLDGAPGAKLIVTGFARYELTSGKYVYREYKVSENSYEGIPRPTDAEAIAFVKAHLNDILAGIRGMIVNADKMEITLCGPEEQKWEWHSANSVSFFVRFKFDMETSYTEVTTFDQLNNVRIYRDDPKGPWLRAIGQEQDRKEIAKVTMTPEEIKNLPHGLPE